MAQQQLSVCIIRNGTKPTGYHIKTLLTNGKISDSLKLKVFADNKINVAEKSQFVLGRLENIVGKGENAGYQHFLLFPQCFQEVCF